MIEERIVCICDVCGKTVAAVARPGQYNETDYVAPGDWGTGAASSDIDICPECLKKLNRPSGICRDLKDMSQAERYAITTSRGGST